MPSYEGSAGGVLCGPRAPRGSSQWCPFTGPLKPSSRETALRAIGSLLSFLHDTGYFRANPLKVIALQTPEKAPQRKVERFLDAALWQHTLRYVEGWPKDTPRQIALFERARWVLSLLYGLDLRRAEVIG
jgi:site-specific recombinase XerC